MKRMTLLVLVVFLCGCVPSLHEFYTEDTLVFEEAILGKWVMEKDLWEFSKGIEENSYKLVITEEEGLSGDFVAHLVKLEEALYLDVFPSELDNVSGWMQMHLVGVHTFMKVERLEPNLVMRAMNPEKVDEMLKKEPGLIKHERVEDRIILTAQPKQLQEFVAKYTATEEFFGDAGEFKRFVPEDPNEPCEEEAEDTE